MVDLMTKWYILHTVSGSEKTVKKMIEDQIKKKDMSDFFEDIVIPVIEVPEVKRGKKVTSEKKIMPGYILMKMRMTDESWHLVKSVPKTTGFLGSKTTPQSLNESEVKEIFKNLENESKVISSSSIYNVGDNIKIIDGPFDSFSGVVEEVDLNGQTLKVSVLIFGKATPIELDFSQVKKG